MTGEREVARVAEWRQREESTGVDRRVLPEALDAAGAAGIIRSQWSEGWGVNKIFGTGAERAPVLDLSCEAYGARVPAGRERSGAGAARRRPGSLPR